VHALEEEQTMQHDLMPLDPLETPSAIVDAVNKETVVYTLEEETAEDEDMEDLSESDLIPTSEAIKNLEVVYEEVDLEDDEDEFIIHEVTRIPSEKTDFEAVEEDQTMLTFDLPISSNSIKSESDSVEVYVLEDSVKDIEVKDIDVNDYIELIPVNEVNETGETRYVLDDHIVLEQTGQKYENKNQADEVEVNEEMTFTKVTVKERTVASEPEETSDPFDSPISITLRERSDERRQKMKAFNYKFNTSKIEEIEKEPAYKRQGVNLNDVEHSSDVQSSRTTIGLDDNDEVQLRSNNSYLHDNVD
jgi:cell division protein FtsZ